MALLSKPKAPPPAPPRPVKTQVIALAPVSDVGSVTGEIKARTETDMGFRIGGRVREGDSVREVPCCLSLFRIGDDGLLSFVRKLDVEVGDKNMFWMGIIDL